MHTVHIPLTSKQHKNILKGKAVRVSHAQLTGEEFNVVPINVDDAMFRKIQSSMRRGKGVQIKSAIHPLPTIEDDASSVEGGKVNWKKVGKTLTKVGNKVVAPTIEQVKKYVPQNVVKKGLIAGADTLLTAGTAMTGIPMVGAIPVVNQGIDSGVDAAYKTDFRKKGALKKFKNEFVKDAATDVAVKSLTGGRLAKGSEEAKARMAHLRSLRGKKKAQGGAMPMTGRMPVAMPKVNPVSVRRGRAIKVGGVGLVPLGSGIVPLGAGFVPL